MTIVLGIPTLNGAIRTRRLIRSVAAGTRVPDMIHVIDNGQQDMSIDDISDGELFAVNATITSPDSNLGVAASWNQILWRTVDAYGEQAIAIIANDDITLGTRAIGLLAAEVEAIESTRYLLAGPRGHVFACFALRPARALEAIGEFDEQFFPAYWEDNDYEHRMRLAGWGALHLDHEPLGFEHAGRATTRQLNDADRARHAQHYLDCRAKYVAKWGGCPPNGELYFAPYDATRLRGFDR